MIGPGWMQLCESPTGPFSREQARRQMEQTALDLQVPPLSISCTPEVPGLTQLRGGCLISPGRDGAELHVASVGPRRSGRGG